jgi:hypothetical protein
MDMVEPYSEHGFRARVSAALGAMGRESGVIMCWNRYVGGGV